MATPSTVLGQVEALYVGYFGRAGDPSGVTSWVAAINSGKATFASIAANFAQATEATTKYPYLLNPTLANPTTFVTAIYANLFNRAPDAAGQTFWVAYLNANNGNATAVGTFISTIITSAAAGGTDDLSVQNKTSVATDFTQQYANTSLPFNSVVAAQSTTELNATTSVASTVTTQIAATSTFITTQQNTPTTFTALTTSSDTVTIAANGTQVTGTSGIASPTFSAGDTITGNGFTNTSVSITDSTAVGTTVNLTTGSPAGATINNVQLFKWLSSSNLTLDTTTSNLGFSGLTALNATTASGGAFIDTIKAAATTSITVADTANTKLTAGQAITGGSTVSFSENNGAFDNSAQTIAVTGLNGTSAVTLTQTNIAAGKGMLETIADANYASTSKAGTITSITINGLDTQGVTITDSALNALSVSNVVTGATVTMGTIAGGNTLTTATVLGLTLSNDAALTLTDTSNFFKTLNVTEGATKSTLAAVNATGITTETITGTSGSTSVLTQTAAGMTGLTSVTISGFAGLTDADLNAGALTKLATVTDTSAGNVIVSLTDTLTSFVGGAATGGEAVTITADATKAITGAGLATSEVVFNAAAATFTSGNTGANVTGFKVLGLAGGSSGTYDLSTSPFAGYTAVDIQATAGATTLNKVTAGTTLAIDTAATGALIYNQAGTSGATGSVALTLGVSAATALLNGVAATGAGFTAASALTLQDSINNGIGTVSFTMNNTTAGSVETLTALSDVGMTSLTLGGSGDLTITNSYSSSVTGLTITDNVAATTGLTFGTSLVDNVLTSLTLAGSNTSTMTLTNIQDSGTSLTVTDSYAGKVSDATLVMASATTETFNNTGGTLTVGSTANVATALATLNLSGAVAYTATGDAVTAGITVAGSTDNSAVSFTVTGGAAAGKTDSFTLGNGANTIVDPGVGTVNITVGTGANGITLSGALVTSLITEGTHTTATADTLAVAQNGNGATTGGTQPTAFTTITGYNNIAGGSDTITFTKDVANTITWGGGTATTAKVTTTTDSTSLISWIQSAETNNAAAHSVSWFQFGGNTYLLESTTAGATSFLAADTLVKLTGLTTFTAAGDVNAAALFKLQA